MIIKIFVFCYEKLIKKILFLLLLDKSNRNKMSKRKLETNSIQNQCKCCGIFPISEATSNNIKMKLSGICNACPVQIDIYLNNLHLIVCKCSQENEFPKCHKCVFDKMIRLNADIPYISYPHISSATKLLAEYDFDPIKQLPNVVNPDKNVSLSLQRWSHLKKLFHQLLNRNDLLKSDRLSNNKANREAYLALDLQFCLGLRADAGQSEGVGVLSFSATNVNQMHTSNGNYILKYEYIGKKVHESQGYRLITKDLYDFFIGKLYKNNGYHSSKIPIFSNLNYVSYNAYLAASFGNQFKTHDVKAVSCCASTQMLFKDCAAQLNSNFYFLLN